MRRLLVAAIALAICVPLLLRAQQQQPPPPAPTGDPQRPVFRGGAYFVTVDVYPTLNGRILTDLTEADFEVLEDGKPQKIESFELVQVAAATAEANLRDPNTLGEMRNRLADPRARVFVLYLDTYHIDWFGAIRLRDPLVQMMNTILAPTDLFGVMTPQVSTHDITFGRKTNNLAEQVNRYWPNAVIDKKIPEEGAERMLENCYATTPAAGILPEVYARRREDMVLTGLEDLIDFLGGVREGRKSIFIFSPGWPLFGQNPALKDAIAKLGPTTGPPLGVTSTGKLILGDKLEHGTMSACDQEVNRLADLENNRRFPQLLREAEAANVSFYPVDPVGVGARSKNVDNLRSMASETDGSAVVMTNDLVTGLERVADSLSAYYLVSYSSPNTKFDGGYRRIDVKVKRAGVVVQARRGYRAPTEAEMSALRGGGAIDRSAGAAVSAALEKLTRIRPGAMLHSYAVQDRDELVVSVELGQAAVDSGAWKEGGDIDVTVSPATGGSIGSAAAKIPAGGRAASVRVPLAGTKGPWRAVVQAKSTGGTPVVDRLSVEPATGVLLGEPTISRSRTATSPLQPAGTPQFTRNERIRIEWPINTPLDKRQARLLGKNGQPLALPVNVTERQADGRTLLAADLLLLPLGLADYVIEVEVGAGSKTERKLVAIRVGTSRP
jgi:VWFA-related protein